MPGGLFYCRHRAEFLTPSMPPPNRRRFPKTSATDSVSRISPSGWIIFSRNNLCTNATFAYCQTAGACAQFQQRHERRHSQPAPIHQGRQHCCGGRQHPFFSYRHFWQAGQPQAEDRLHRLRRPRHRSSSTGTHGRQQRGALVHGRGIPRSAGPFAG